MLQRLIFVRHGESRHAVDGLMGGWTDSPLTALGERQVEALADRLAGWNLEAPIGLYSSDLARAADSAAIVGAALGLETMAMAGLREVNTGDAAGLPKEEAERLNGPEPDPPDLDWRPNAGAETYREMAERLAAALRRIEAEGMATAIVVGHGLSGQELLRSWLGLPLEAKIAFRFDHASLTEGRINRWGERQIERLNVTVPVGRSDRPSGSEVG